MVFLQEAVRFRPEYTIGNTVNHPDFPGDQNLSEDGVIGRQGDAIYAREGTQGITLGIEEEPRMG